MAPVARLVSRMLAAEVAQYSTTWRPTWVRLASFQIQYRLIRYDGTVATTLAISGGGGGADRVAAVQNEQRRPR